MCARGWAAMACYDVDACDVWRGGGGGRRRRNRRAAPQRVAVAANCISRTAALSTRTTPRRNTLPRTLGFGNFDRCQTHSITRPFSLHYSCRTSTQRYLQPPFVEPMCVSGHCAPQPRSSSAVVWGACDMWMFRGSRAWSQWGVVQHFHVLLACRKFWFCVYTNHVAAN
jgi:hypothetical protein